MKNTNQGKASWHRYRVKNPFSPEDFALMLAAMVAIVVMIGLIGIVFQTPLGALLAATIVVPLQWYLAKRTAFGVFSEGLLVHGTQVPWEVVDQVHVTTDRRGGETEFAVRLNERASRTLGLKWPTDDDDGFHLRHTTTGRFDPTKLRKAVAAYAWPSVQLTGLDQVGGKDGRLSL